MIEDSGIVLMSLHRRADQIEFFLDHTQRVTWTYCGRMRIELARINGELARRADRDNSRRRRCWHGLPVPKRAPTPRGGTQGQQQ